MKREVARSRATVIRNSAIRKPRSLTREMERLKLRLNGEYTSGFGTCSRADPRHQQGQLRGTTQTKDALRARRCCFTFRMMQGGKEQRVTRSRNRYVSSGGIPPKVGISRPSSCEERRLLSGRLGAWASRAESRATATARSARLGRRGVPIVGRLPGLHRRPGRCDRRSRQCRDSRRRSLCDRWRRSCPEDSRTVSRS